MVRDDRIEAVFVATDAPSHARHCIDALNRGKHVASAVPAVFGSLEDAEALFEAVKRTGRKYMMFETSCFHEDLYAMRQIYNAGGLGAWSTPRASITTTWPSQSTRSKAGASACRRSGIRPIPTRITSA